MSCGVCFSTFEETKPIQLECSCIHCSDCLALWVQMEINELRYYASENIKCMNSNCREPFKVQDILAQFPEQIKEELDISLLNFHLRSAKDIRKCPKENCDYAGTIDLKSSCVDDLECIKCGTHWREKTHFSLTEKVLSTLTNLEFWSSEAFSEVWEEFFTNKCPNCHVNIERSGGCPHMTCKKCEYEFCWHCKQGHKNHLSSKCMTKGAIKVVFLATMLFHILYLTGIMTVLESIFLWIISCSLKACFLNLFLYLALPFMHNRKSCFAAFSRKGVRIPFLVGLISVFMLIVHNYNMYLCLLQIFIFEISVLGALLFYSQYLSNWLHSVY